MCLGDCCSHVDLPLAIHEGDQILFYKPENISYKEVLLLKSRTRRNQKFLCNLLIGRILLTSNLLEVLCTILTKRQPDY